MSLLCASKSCIIGISKNRAAFWWYCVLKRISRAWLRGYVTDGLRRALEWHSRGQRFDPAYPHQLERVKKDLKLWFQVFFCFERAKSRIFIFSQLPPGPRRPPCSCAFLSSSRPDRRAGISKGAFEALPCGRVMRPNLDLMALGRLF